MGGPCGEPQGSPGPLAGTPTRTVPPTPIGVGERTNLTALEELHHGHVPRPAIRYVFTPAQSAYVFTAAPFWFVVQFMLYHGHQADEPLRSRFVGVLLSLADLDTYPRRAELLAAYRPGGDFRERCTEAAALGRAGYLAKCDFHFVAEQAADPEDDFAARAAASLLAGVAY